MKCPYCGNHSRHCDSHKISKKAREIFRQCMNVQCGYTFVTIEEIVRTISPSAYLNPDLDLDIPLARRSRKSSTAKQRTDQGDA